MKNFAIIGAAGFIAERHLRAVKETGNRVVAATDTFDVMGRMDSFFPEAEFFLDFSKFEKFLSEEQKTDHPIEYISICSPNYLHAQHIQSALNNNAFAICEKPLVLYPEEIEAIEKAQLSTGKKVFNILQLRLHPTIIALREKIKNGPKDKSYDIDLTYITSRGKWYYKSWKGDIEKSGGIATNIGIHFFDMLQWIFGEVQNSIVHLYEADKAAGFLQLKNARVRWYLSLDNNDIPLEAKERGMRTYRSISVEGNEIEFSGGFTDLHTQTYQQILSGNGFGLEDARPCILLTHEIRNTKPVGAIGDFHPMVIK
ncbi:Gfo/Idh/MocA family protein [Sunxiuqinia indica]|uniref:Gfo/Idh/MocA family protein n=1 Tax=Sunxiuqinia indica TaxID=2692584 RepID=UPI001356F871|nr:Gfo/Idh/MocA family oxidoreductase [Sunxiuqinia indica]